MAAKIPSDKTIMSLILSRCGICRCHTIEMGTRAHAASVMTPIVIKVYPIGLMRKSIGQLPASGSQRARTGWQIVKRYMIPAAYATLQNINTAQTMYRWIGLVAMRRMVMHTDVLMEAIAKR